MMGDGQEQTLRCALIGKLQRDTILPVSGPPAIDVLGGNLTYAAVGMHLWEEKAGLLAKINADFPQAWLKQFENWGFDTQGIKVAPEGMDMRRFVAYSNPQSPHYEAPITYFAERELAFPPKLLEYYSGGVKLCSKTQYDPWSIRISDIPAAYQEVSAVHICPIDYISHATLPTILRGEHVQTITMSPAPGYMDPVFWDEMPGLLSDLTAFMAGEDEVRQLFQGCSNDLWEIAKQLSDYGPEYVLIRLKDWGQYLYDGVSGRRRVVPSYPVQVVDPSGAADAFAGGFLAVYSQTYDPLEAALCGNIAASLVLEGCGPFFALSAMSGLKEARLAALRDMVSEV
ncbi:MAG: carbohydrate kinase family protein [Chloroflexota bacterium]